MKTEQDCVSKIIQGLGSILIILMTVLVSLQIMFRYFSSFSLTWSSELASLLLVWLSFLGAISIQADDSHVAVDVLLVRIPGKIRTWVRVLGRLMMMAMFVAIIFTSIPILKTALTIEGSSLPVSLFWSRLPVDIAALGCLVYTFLQLISDIRCLKGQ